MTKRLRDDAIAGLLKQPIADCLIGSTFSIAHHCDERGYQSYGDDEYELINKTPIKRRKRDEILASDSECSDVRTKLELSTDDLGNAIAQARIIQQVSITNQIKAYISKEMQILQRHQEVMEQGRESNRELKLENLTKRGALHETNNFIFLQLGYVLSYEDLPSDQCTNSRSWNTTRKCKDGNVPYYYYSMSINKCWETNRATPVLGLLQVLQKIHEYNCLRQYATSKFKKIDGAYSALSPECALPFQLENAELEEIISVIDKVLGHALINFNGSSKESENINDGSSTESKIERESLSELSLLMFESCLGILQVMNSMNNWIKIDMSKKNGILETLVRIVLDITRNSVSLLEIGLKNNFDAVRSQTRLLLKNLTQTSIPKGETSTAEYAFLCAEIAMTFEEDNISGPNKNFTEYSEHEIESFPGHSMIDSANLCSEHNQSAANTSDVGHNLISLLQHMCSSLRSKRVKKDLAKKELSTYFNTISSMMNSSVRDDRLVENILVVIHYFAISPSIAVAMSRHSSLINSIASFATVPQTSDENKENPKLYIDLRATRCITLMAHQIITCSNDVSDCINVAILLSKMVIFSGRIEKQMELTMSLCLIMKQYPEAFMGVIKNKGREELKNFLSRLAEVIEFRQRYGCGSYAAKESATEILVHIFFNQANQDWRSSEIKNVVKRILISRNETCETMYIKLMNKNRVQDRHMLRLGKENYFLNALASVTCNDSHSMDIKEGAMRILAVLSTNSSVSEVMMMNESVSNCLMSYISFRGLNKGSKCCHLALETIIGASSFPPNRRRLLDKRGMMGYLVKLARTIPDINESVKSEAVVDCEGSISQVALTLKTRLKQAITDLVSSL